MAGTIEIDRETPRLLAAVDAGYTIMRGQPINKHALIAAADRALANV